jgi:hypothetical protein
MKYKVSNSLPLEQSGGLILEDFTSGILGNVMTPGQHFQ